MKLHQTLFLLILSLHCHAQQKRVLFLGNSYTYVNDLPSTLNQLANPLGDTLIWDQNTPGGHQLVQHVTNTASLSKISKGDWDFVVLQEQSQKPSFPPAQVATDVLPYAAQLVDSVKAANTCTEPIFFMTWGRKNGDAQNCQFYTPLCTYEGMQTRLRESYLLMAQQNDATVSPVGAVWKAVRDSLPSLDLYTADESHPSFAGTYVAACTFYATIFRKSPVGSPFRGTLSSSDAAAIQYLSEKVVLDSLGHWSIGHQDVTASFSVSGVGLSYTFTNLSVNGNQYQWDLGDGTTSTQTSFPHDFTGPGNYTITLIAENSCEKDTMVQTLSILTSDLEEFDQSVVVYPNPTNGILQIEVGEPPEGIEVYAVDGKRMLKQNSSWLNLSMLPRGTYLLKVILNDKTIVRRIIKE